MYLIEASAFAKISSPAGTSRTPKPLDAIAVNFIHEKGAQNAN